MTVNKSFACDAKRRQPLLSLPLCCAVAGRVSPSTPPCHPADSGSPTPPTSPAPPPPSPGIVAVLVEPTHAPRHQHLFTARLKRLERALP